MEKIEINRGCNKSLREYNEIFHVIIQIKHIKKYPTYSHSILMDQSNGHREANCRLYIILSWPLDQFSCKHFSRVLTLCCISGAIRKLREYMCSLLPESSL